LIPWRKKEKKKSFVSRMGKRIQVLSEGGFGSKNGL